jgi:hypothetical protein
MCIGLEFRGCQMGVEKEYSTTRLEQMRAVAGCYYLNTMCVPFVAFVFSRPYSRR